jgi:hypothetical protein
MSDETPISTSLAGPLPGIRWVKTPVTFRPFRKSISRITMLLTSPKVPPVKLESGSTTTTEGCTSSTSRCMVARWNSRPYKVGRAAWIRSMPFLTHPSRSRPIDRMFRVYWAGDSSN